MLRNSIIVLPSNSVSIKANILQAATCKITVRWYVKIHTASEKCNNIVLCVHIAPSLKGSLIPRCIHCLFSTAL